MSPSLKPAWKRKHVELHLWVRPEERGELRLAAAARHTTMSNIIRIALRLYKEHNHE